MKNKIAILLLLALLQVGVHSVYAQKNWNKQAKESPLLQKKKLYKKKNFPLKYEVLTLNRGSFEAALNKKSAKNKYIKLPNADGVLSKFIVKENSNFDEVLQAKFPNIKSYTAQGIDDPTAIAKISVGTDGLHAVIFSGKKETLYIDPYTKDNKVYIVYKRSSLHKTDQDFKCLVEETAKKEFKGLNFARNANDGKLRTFRLALVCSAEYAQFHLGASQQNVPDSATDQDKKAAVLSAMNTSMTRINGVFEKDLAVKMVLVSTNDKLIFLDADTDGITEGNPNTMIEEVQTICDREIGNANYDIGHLFSTAGDGLAGLGVVCLASNKARGVTGIGSPVGDPYDIDYVAHEMGHQFGATHTQNNDNCNRTNETAVEPGSGSTIMGYAGICSPNVQEGNSNGNSDDYFHAVSIAQMWNHIKTSGSCGVLSDTDNTAPTADAGLDYSIPKSTPFKLTGAATDVDGTNSLTYNWEQIDNEVGSMPPSSTSTDGPMFRSLPSKMVPVRYMPVLDTVVAGKIASTWEVVPSVERALNFSFLVRDNHAGGGSTARDDMKVNVTDADPFIVTSQNANESYTSGETVSISWQKGTTDVAPINCENVNIKLSVDGGVTFPIVLKTNTPNDGVEAVIIPDNSTSEARIMIEASDNIFYNVNNAVFTIVSSTPTFLISDTSGSQSVCNTSNQSVEYDLEFDFINGFSETATLSASGQPTGATVVFNPNTINADGVVKMTVSDLEGKEAENYTINVVATSATVTQNLEVVLDLKSSVFSSINLISPADQATGITLTEMLTWEVDTNALSYDVEIATDSNFQNIISSGNVPENKYTSSNLSGETQYFWRVRSKNDCGMSSFSNAFSFTTEIPMYCSSTFTDEAGGTEHITNVTFNTINSSSGNNTQNGYEDFTNIETGVYRGDTHTISVTLDTGGFQDHCYVFIDWNQDFTFDKATERYDLGTKLDDVATATFDINVPNDAVFGTTRMRVVLEYDDPNDDFGDGACDADHLSEWGETEDYSLVIIDPDNPNIRSNNITVQSTSESCVDKDDGIIAISINQFYFDYEVTLTGDSGILNEQISGASHEFEDLVPGDYEVCVRVANLNYERCYEVNIEESSPISLKATSKKESNTYFFNVDSGTPPYNVYLNNALIKVSETRNFELEIHEGGKLEVKTAKECEGLFKTSIGEVLLKQNPISEDITFLLPIGVGESLIKTVVFDVNGQMVFNQAVKKEGNNLIIPFKNYASGVYIVKLSIENSKPIKIIKQ